VWPYELHRGGRREECRDERHEERYEECRRCARLELELINLRAELAAARPGDRVVVVRPDPWPPAGVPGSRLAVLVLKLFASYRDHPWVWAFITLVSGSVLVAIVYGTVRFLTGG
jgi:hypothetical protein